MDEKVDSGLHLIDKVIHRISGPASMHYLKPRDPTHTDLPLVLLWGDRHQSDSDMCNNCECESEQGRCCYKIYDKPFLKELDKIAEHVPVDFYTELHRERIRPYHGKQNVLFYHFLSELTQPCHDVSLRSKKNYTKECPTEFIRWHYGDLRRMTHILEHYVFVYQDNILFEVSKLDKIDYGSRPRDIIPDLQRIYRKQLDPPDAPSPPLSNNDPEYRTYLMKKEGYALRSKLVPLFFKRIAEPIIIQANGKKELSPIIHEKYTAIFKVLVEGLRNSPFSIIYKQIRKNPSKELAFDTVLVDLIKNTFFYENFGDGSKSSTLLRMEKQLSEYEPFLLDFVSSFLSDGDLSAYVKNDNTLTPNGSRIINHVEDGFFYMVRNCIEQLLIFTFYTRSLMVDIYTIFRMMKPPQGNSPPVISFGFFGTAHCLRSSFILQTCPLFNYEQVYHKEVSKQRNDPERRCITIDKPIYLASDIKEHASYLFAQYPERLKAFHNRLKEEKIARNDVNMNVPNHKEGGYRKKRSTRKKSKSKSKSRARRKSKKHC